MISNEKDMLNMSCAEVRIPEVRIMQAKSEFKSCSRSESPGPGAGAPKVAKVGTGHWCHWLTDE